MVISYECNRKKCKRCIDSCHHTTDIKYAKNFIETIDGYEELESERRKLIEFRDRLVAGLK